MLADRLNRPIKDLRISVTDRCNFRCPYCMPADRVYRFMEKGKLLTFEEVARLTRIFAELGVGKIRLTGGEPLLRRDLPVLVDMLAKSGVPDIAMTTNGFYLTRHLMALREAGLKRLTISLDSLDEKVFRESIGRDISPRVVLDAIDHAAAFFESLKINMVVRRGINDQEVLTMAERFRNTPHIPRFIEFMDVGNLNGWDLSGVVTADEIVACIDRHYPVAAVPPQYPGEVANRYRYLDGDGEFGVIASVSRPFCGGCTRARLSADGHLFTCLFANQGFDLKTPLRNGADDDEMRGLIEGVWSKRKDRYSELRGELTPELTEKVEMYHIGG